MLMEGALGIVSVKSDLNMPELHKALLEIASIPKTEPLDRRIPPGFNIKNYEDWPLKIIYATDGIKYETLLRHLTDFYIKNPQIHQSRQPNFIHVSGKYLIARAWEGMSSYDQKTKKTIVLSPGAYYAFEVDADLQATIQILKEFQNRVIASTQILYLYNTLFDNILLLPENTQDT